MYRHLFTKEKYFRQVRRLIETRIPPLLETTTRPPTPLAGELLNMVARPLQAVQVIFFVVLHSKELNLPSFFFWSSSIILSGAPGSFPDHRDDAPALPGVPFPRSFRSGGIDSSNIVSKYNFVNNLRFTSFSFPHLQASTF